MAEFNEIATLLHIHEKAAAHGTALKNIVDAAYNRLVQINGEIGVDAFMQQPPAPTEVPQEPESLQEPEVSQEPEDQPNIGRV